MKSSSSISSLDLRSASAVLINVDSCDQTTSRDVMTSLSRDDRRRLLRQQRHLAATQRLTSPDSASSVSSLATVLDDDDRYRAADMALRGGVPPPTRPSIPPQSGTVAAALRAGPARGGLGPRGATSVMDGSDCQELPSRTSTCRSRWAGEAVAAMMRRGAEERDTTSRCAADCSDRASQPSSRDPAYHPRADDVRFQPTHGHRSVDERCCRSTSGVAASAADRKSRLYRKHFDDDADDSRCRPAAMSATSLQRLPER